jgi:hypothetical protein
MVQIGIIITFARISSLRKSENDVGAVPQWMSTPAKGTCEHRFACSQDGREFPIVLLQEPERRKYSLPSLQAAGSGRFLHVSSP